MFRTDEDTPCLARKFVSVVLVFALFSTSPGVAAIVDEVWERLELGRDPVGFAAARGVPVADLVSLIAGGKEFFMTQDMARRVLRQNRYGGLEGVDEEVISLGADCGALECHRLDGPSTATFGDFFAARELERHLWGEAPEEAELWLLRNVHISYPDCSLPANEALFRSWQLEFANGTISEGFVRDFDASHRILHLLQNRSLEYGVEVRIVPQGSQRLTSEVLGREPVDSESFARVVFNSLILHPTKASFDNFRLVPHVGQRHCISPVRTFDGVNPSSVSRVVYGPNMGKHAVLVNNDFYAIGDRVLDTVVAPRSLERIRSIVPEVVVSNWLMGIGRLNQVLLDKEFSPYWAWYGEGMEALRSPILAEEERLVRKAEMDQRLLADQRRFRSHLFEAGLPVHIKRGAVKALLHTLHDVCSYLKSPQNLSGITYKQLLEFGDFFAFRMHRPTRRIGYLEDAIGREPFPGLSGKTISDILRQSDHFSEEFGLVTIAEGFKEFLEFSYGFQGDLGTDTFDLDLFNTIAAGLETRILPRNFRVRIDDENLKKIYFFLQRPGVSSDCVRFAKRLGLDLNLSDSEGRTFLHRAVERMDEDWVRALLDCGVNTELVWTSSLRGEGDKRTALDLLVSQRQDPRAPAIFCALLERRGVGSGLINPEAALEWYRELPKPAERIEPPLKEAFINLARRHQKFSWLAVLEDVFFPRAFGITPAEMRRQLKQQVLTDSRMKRRYERREEEAVEDGGSFVECDHLLVEAVRGYLKETLTGIDQAVGYLDLREEPLQGGTPTSQLKAYLGKLGYAGPEATVLLEARNFLGFEVGSVEDALPRVLLKDYLVKLGYVRNEDALGDEVLLRGARDLVEERVRSLEEAYYAFQFATDRHAPWLVEGAESGPRLLGDDIRQQLWGDRSHFRRVNAEGRRSVGKVFKRDGLLDESGVLFFKRFPELPGYEAAAGIAMRDLVGHGTPFSDLFNIRGMPYLVSQGIPDHQGEWKTLLSGEFGVLRRDDVAVREKAKEIFEILDPVDTAELILMAMVLNPEDGKLDNFVLTSTLEADSLRRLVSIDNDHVFAPPIGDPTIQAQLREARLTQVETLLFALGQKRLGVEGPMDWKIPPSVAEKFKEIDPQRFVVKWLDKVARISARYAALFPDIQNIDVRDSSGVVRRLTLSPLPYLWERQESCVRIPVNDRVVGVVYDNLCQIKEILASCHSDITPMQLLSSLSPVLTDRGRLGFLGIHSSSATAVARTLGFGTTRETIAASISPGGALLSGLTLRMGRTIEQLARLELSARELKSARKKAADESRSRAEVPPLTPERLRASLEQHTAVSQEVFAFLTADADVAVRSDYQLCRFLKNTDMQKWPSAEQRRLIDVLRGRGIARFPLTRLTFGNCTELSLRDFTTPGETTFSDKVLFHLSLPGCNPNLDAPRSGETSGRGGIKDFFTTMDVRGFAGTPLVFAGLKLLDISRTNLGREVVLSGGFAPTLETLMIKGVEDLVRVELISFPHLKLLSLSGCKNLGEINIKKMVGGSPSAPLSTLQEIRLNGVASWNDSKQDELVACTPKLARMRLQGTKVTLPGLREVYPREPSEKFFRLTREIKASALFEEEDFVLDGLRTQSAWVTPENFSHLGVSTGLGVLGVFFPYVGIPLGLVWGVGVGIKKALDRGKLEGAAGGSGTVAGTVAAGAANRGIVLPVASSLGREIAEEMTEEAVDILAKQALAYSAKKAAEKAAEAAVKGGVDLAAKKAVEVAAKASLDAATKKAAEAAAKAVVDAAAKAAAEAAARELAEATAKAAAAAAAREAAEVAAKKTAEFAARSAAEAAAIQAAKETAKKTVETAAKAATVGVSSVLGGAFAAFDVIMDERDRSRIMRVFIGSLFSEGIRRNSRLRRLDLSNVGLGDEGFSLIADALMGNSSITNLVLSDCGVGDKGVERLALALRGNVTLSSLGLKKNNITDKGAKALYESLESNATLRILDVSENRKIGEARREDLTRLMVRNSLVGSPGVGTQRGFLRGNLDGQGILFSRCILEEDAPYFGYNGLGIGRLTVARLLFDGLRDEGVRSSIAEEASWALQNGFMPTGFPEWCRLLQRQESREVRGWSARAVAQVRDRLVGVGVALTAAVTASVSSKAVLWEDGEDMPLVQGSAEGGMRSLRGISAVSKFLAEYVKCSVVNEPWLRCNVEVKESLGILRAIAQLTRTTLFIWRIGARGTLELQERLGGAGSSGSVEEGVHILKSRIDSLEKSERLIISGSSKNPLAPEVSPGVRRETGRRHRFGLSIDGGGMRGLIPAVMLSRLEGMARDYGRRSVRIHDLFDCIGGTSIGGVLALGLTIPKADGSPSLECAGLEELFTRHGRDIFGRRPVGVLSGLFFTPKYDAQPLEALLREKLGDARIGSALKPVLITAVRVDSSPYRASVFNSAVENHGAWPAWQAARATAAAPTYFAAPTFSWPSDRDGMPRPVCTFWDGGVWANNPAELVLDNICRIYSVGRESVSILSFGTGETETSYFPPSASGAYHPKTIKGLIYGQMDLGAAAVDARMRMFGDRYVRLQPSIVDDSGRAIQAELDNCTGCMLEKYREAADRKFREERVALELLVRQALGT